MQLKYLFAFLITVPMTALGQPSDTAPLRLRDVMVFAGTGNYPQALADKCVQGRAVFSTEVNVDGTFAPATLVESSGSAELDAAAMEQVARLKANPQEAPKPVLLPILFYKDSLNNLHLKTCAQFNADHAYFAATFPARPVGDMNVFDMATGVLAAVRGMDMSAISRLSAAPQKTMEACAKRPKRLFMEEFLASSGK